MTDLGNRGCAWCGAEFAMSHPSEWYCSDGCVGSGAAAIRRARYEAAQILGDNPIHLSVVVVEAEEILRQFRMEESS